MKKQALEMITAALLSLLMIIAGLFFTLSALINDEQFFYSTYGRIGNAKYMGMSDADLVKATMQMIYYMEGKAESIDVIVNVDGDQVQMFNDRERAHMIDVRELYLNVQTVAFVFTGLYALMLVYFIVKRSFSPALAFVYASGAFLAFILFIGAWAAIDFSSFWVSFHHVFFTNDLWLLDPTTSRMINMMPQELFSSIVATFVIRFVIIWVVLLAAALLYLRNKRRRVQA